MQLPRKVSGYLSGYATGHEGEAAATAPVVRPRVFWSLVFLTVAAWVAPILWLHAVNSRLLPSWHGFLHAAIATRFPGPVPPENPFFAGEQLPYYWFYQFLAGGVTRLIGIDLLHVFQFLTLASLVILVVFAALIGRRLFRTVGAGLLIGYLVLAGLNPLGPVIAAARYLVTGQALLSAVTGPTETVFVSNRLADDLMVHPLLPSLYISGDWRHGQNLVWFLDISSRTPALALILVLMFLVLGWRLAPVRLAAVILVAALTTALNPLIGIATAGSLAAAFLGLALWQACTREVGLSKSRALLSGISLCVALVAGPILALPTYHHLFGLAGASSLTGAHYAAIKLASLAVNFLLLVPLALLGVWKASPAVRAPLVAITTAGLSLLLAVPVVHLEQGNEHNLVNVAQCLLAVPAVAWIPNLRGAPILRRRWLSPIMVFAIFLPTTVCGLVAFADRPGLPLAFSGRNLHRRPEQDALNRFYDWVRTQTPEGAVFICDPARPVKMSGNVAEFPAFTGRALFTDQASYLTRPYPDAALRAEIASDAVTGQVLTPAQQSYLHGLRRPLYLITYQGQDQALVTRLISHHGAPVFRLGFVAVFETSGL